LSLDKRTRTSASRIALIPARGGSKGIEGKNLRELLGRPLVTWPIEAAKQTGMFDRIICSTDSPEIAEVARDAGAEILGLRPEHLSRDETSTADVIDHIIVQLENSQEIDGRTSITLLEPTSPLTSKDDIKKALVKFEKSKCTSLVSISPLISGHPDFSFKLDILTGNIQHLQKGDWIHKRRQDISNLYFLDGSLYISQVESFKKFHKFIQDSTCGFQLENWKSFEVDEEIDLVIIEAIMLAKGY
jgi:CMP-N,N'-diacetyllegionaminic acid synthase